MNTQYSQRIWAEREKTLPSCIDNDNLTETLQKYGEKHEAQETMFVIEHSAHGSVVLKHVQIVETIVHLSPAHRSWIRCEKKDAEKTLKWEYHLTCKTCHHSLVVVDANTPDEFKSI